VLLLRSKRGKLLLETSSRIRWPGRKTLDVIDVLPGAGVERQMVQAGPEPVVLGGGQGRRLLDDQVRTAEAPAAAVGPVLEGRIAEPAEQPSPLLAGPAQVGHPQFDVEQAPGDGLVHALPSRPAG
jgi:hypothetical protein